MNRKRRCRAVGESDLNSMAQTVCIALLLLFYGCAAFLGEWGAEPLALRAMGWMSVLLLVLGFLYSRSSGGGIISPLNIFLLSFWLFTMGQVALIAFGADRFTGFDIRKHFSVDQINTAALYTLICLVSFFWGTLLVEAKIKRDLCLSDVVIDEDLVFRRAGSVGRAVMLVTISPFLVHQFLLLRMASEMGYSAMADFSAYGSSTLMKIFEVTTVYFRVAVFLVLLSCHTNRRRFDICACVFLIHPVSLLLAGERTESTAMLLLLIWLRHLFFGRANIRSVLGVAVVATILMLTYPAIMKSRAEGIIAPAVMWESVKETGLIGSVVDAIAILGYSVFPLIQTMALVPGVEGFRYGLTYLFAVTAVVPYLGLAKEHSALGRWLMNELGMSYGPGYSMPAEAYINFGWFPLLVMVFAGYLIGSVLFVRPRGSGQAASMVLAIGFLLTNVTLPRREFLGAVRDIVFIMVPVYLLVVSPVRSFRGRSIRRANGRQKGAVCQ